MFVLSCVQWSPAAWWVEGGVSTGTPLGPGRITWEICSVFSSFTHFSHVRPQCYDAVNIFFDANASLAIFSSLSQASHRLSVSYAALWLVVQHGAMLAFNFNLNAVPTAIVAHPWPRLKWIYWYMEQKPFSIKNILRYFLYQSWIWAVQDGQDAFPSNLSVGAAE